jgi:hypothetical protein
MVTLPRSRFEQDGIEVKLDPVSFRCRDRLPGIGVKVVMFGISDGVHAASRS